MFEGPYHLGQLFQKCLLGYRLIWLLISYISDDVQEAYNLIKDLEPTTPQVIDNVLRFY